MTRARRGIGAQEAGVRIPDKQAIFFELDGVLVAQPKLEPDGSVPWLPGAREALERIDQRTFLLFIGTAREDIAFGRLRERDFKRLCDALIADCTARHVHFQKIYSCPFHPKGHARYRKESVFRKPAPGIYKMAQQEFDLNLARCWAIGHRTTDVLAAQRAGTGTILVQTGAAGQDGAFVVEPHRTARDLRDAIRQIHAFELASRS
ncbi:MAG: HAD-IIIA family hydrolase [Planctomycetes bacterium]|nr:HAD-IIIA family hydrolase [Planctomycetota bacterium]